MGLRSLARLCLYMAIKGTLVGLTSAELTSVRSAALACILANSVRGVNYSIAGRSFGFPSLADAQQLLLEANFAAARLSAPENWFSNDASIRFPAPHTRRFW